VFGTFIYLSEIRIVSAAFVASFSVVNSFPKAMVTPTPNFSFSVSVG